MAAIAKPLITESNAQEEGERPPLEATTKERSEDRE
jgi:hypothetical protein